MMVRRARRPGREEFLGTKLASSPACCKAHLANSSQFLLTVPTTALSIDGEAVEEAVAP